MGGVARPVAEVAVALVVGVVVDGAVVDGFVRDMVFSRVRTSSVMAGMGLLSLRSIGLELLPLDASRMEQEMRRVSRGFSAVRRYRRWTAGGR
jgi:hypothetical protein